MTLEVFPVIHINEVSQVLAQAEHCYESGADGIYLIDHNSRSDPTFLVQTYNEVDDHYPGRFIGLNFLQLTSGYSAFSFIYNALQKGRIQRQPDSIWEDDARPRRYELMNLREDHPELALIRYLGGVAFKYTSTYTDHPGLATTEAKRLAPVVDVVTTSGKGTGHPPSPEKIKVMKNAIGSKKLAVASGISADNIASYSGLFDQLLVSTSIEVVPYSGIFEPDKLKQLIELAKTI